MADVKMTKKDWYDVVIAMVRSTGDERTEGAVAFLEHEKELLVNRKSTPTKAQKENVSISETIYEVLKDIGKPVTVTEILTDSRLSGYTNQKVSALLRGLKDAGKVDKTIDHKKAYYFAVG